MQKSLNDLTRSDVYLTQGPKRLKNDEKPLVLLCFRSTMLTNHWFYDVFAQKTKILKNHWFYCILAQKMKKRYVFCVFGLNLGITYSAFICFLIKNLHFL